MNQNDELLAKENILVYLRNNGYDSSNIKTEVRLKNGHIADFVVTDENENAYFIVEVKTRDSKYLQISDSDSYLFNPIVREVQSLAIDQGVNNFLISDGNQFLWFTINNSSGRPELLAKPLVPKNNNEQSPDTFTKDNVKQVFQQIENLLINYGLQNEIAGSFIYSYLLTYTDEKKLQNKNQKALYESFDNNAYMLDNKTKNIPDSIKHGIFDILFYTNIFEANPEFILFAIDEIFIIPNAKGEYYLPRLLSDFMLAFIDLSNKYSLLDINCGYGNLLVAALLRNNKGEIKGITQNINVALWAKIQCLLLGKSEENIIIKSPLSVDSQIFSRSNNIVSAPPFNQRLFGPVNIADLPIKQSYTSQEISIVRSINEIEIGGRMVFLVPDNMLFSKENKYVRKLLLSKTHIKAIVSLPAGIFSENSNLKTSLIIADKVVETDRANEIFIGEINTKFINRKIFYYDQISVFKELIEKFFAKFERVTDTPQLRTWIIFQTELTDDNFASTIHLEKYLINQPKNSQYQLKQLKNLSKLIKKGSSIRLVDQGDIPLIGPASVRENSIVEDGFGKTNGSNIPISATQININDIVVNGIGTHLGEAALIEKEELHNSYISQHIILIRPNIEYILPKYLAIALNSSYVREQIIQIASGTIIAGLSSKVLESILIPVPSVSEQESIIKEFQILEKKILQAKTELDQAQQKYKKMLQNFGQEELE